MELQLSNDQIATMAPDASSLSAGKKLSSTKQWKTLGHSSEALWGECQGSALYQVKVDLTALAVQCSCPSRKQPCKHGLGLLLLAVNTPGAIPEAEQPEWITSWLAKRSASQKRKEAREAAPPRTTPSASSVKTAEKRLTQVKAGIEQLDLWLNDLVRNGLGNLGSQPGTFWESQAAQMVDAQAPGIATRIRRMAQIPNAWSNWPERLLTQLGKLALLTQAFQNIDQLDPALQDEVRQLVGWTFKEDEVIARGEHVTDDWLFLGQQIEDRDRGRTQNTWLFGLSSKRAAVISQFAATGTAFTETYALGVRQKAELVFWPGVRSQRALIAARLDEITAIQDERLPGYETIEACFENIATLLAHNPWQEAFFCILNTVIPSVSTDGNWYMYIRDRDGKMLPLAGNHWHLLAVSGGLPVDLVGRWNGEWLIPSGFLMDHTYYVL